MFQVILPKGRMTFAPRKFVNTLLAFIIHPSFSRASDTWLDG